MVEKEENFSGFPLFLEKSNDQKDSLSKIKICSFEYQTKTILLAIKTTLFTCHRIWV